MKSLQNAVSDCRSWLDERVGLEFALKLLKKKDVPVHRHTLWYYLGGMSLFLFMIQFATGVLLLFYYRPGAGEAFESIQFLMVAVNFGWLVRSLHAWSANLLIFSLVLHLFSVFFLRAYRRPRELTWYTGVFVLFICLGFGFTGYLLPWNELAYFATKIGTEITSVMPFVGDLALRVLRGGEQVTSATLTRFYAIHVAILPAISVALLMIHLFLVQRHGMSVPPGIERPGVRTKTMRFLPDFLLRDLVGWMLALAVLMSLAVFFPAELGRRADPFAAAPEGIRPEWYFMFMFQTLKLLPPHILGIEGETVGMLGFGLAGFLLVLMPFLDRGTPDGAKNMLLRWIGLAAIVYMVLMTYLGYVS